PRPESGRDNVALLYLLALDGLADHLANGSVRIDVPDDHFADVFGSGLGAIDVDLVTGYQSIVRAAGQHRQPILLVLSNLSFNARRTRERLELADVVRKTLAPEVRGIAGCSVAKVSLVALGRVEHSLELADLVVQLGHPKFERVALLLDLCLLGT